MLGVVLAACSSPGSNVPQPYRLGPKLWEDRNLSIMAAPTGNVFLSDLNWVTATNGWGPVERDQSNGETVAGDGRTLTLNGVTYAKGLGAHASSEIVYSLEANCSRFQAVVGLDDEIDTQTQWGSVVFQVFADGVSLFNSGVMRGNSPSQAIDVDVTGRQQLRLVISDGGDNVYYDHANWANARLVCAGSTGLLNPTGFTASATSPTSIALSWNPSSGATGYILERRTPSTSFTQIATPTATTFTDTDLTASTTYTYRVKATNGTEITTGVETSTTTPAANPQQTPYGRSTPWPVPGLIQFEDFDAGGQGISFSDSDTLNRGGSYRDTPVDVLAGTGWGLVGWTAAGEWLEYTVAVAQTGNYDLRVRVNNRMAGARFRVLVDDQDVTGLLDVPATGDWNTYNTVTRAAIPLTAGTRVVRFSFEAVSATDFAAGNYDWFEWVAGSSQPQPPANPSTFTANATSASSVVLNWSAVTGATSYALDRRVGTGSYSVLASNLTALTYTDNTVTANTTYTYRVRAVNAAGSSGGVEQQVTTPAAATGGNGLSGRYYDNIDFTGTSFTRTDATINFNWGTGSPDPRIGPDTFSVRWTGQLEARFSETYTFITRTDDGVRLWVNNQLLIDRWVNQSPTERSGTITLVAGQRYTVRMEYYESGVGAVAQLFWSSPSQPREIIPQRYLYSDSNQPDPVAAPTDLIAVGLSAGSVYLDWSAVSGASSYIVERRTGSSGSFVQVGSPTASSFVDNGLSASTTYSYQVVALVNGVRGSAASASVTTPPIEAPINGGSTASTRGVFGPVRDFPLVATHAALLPDGKVIAWYSYDRIGVYRDMQDANAAFHQSSIVTLWDPVTNTFEEVNNNTTDLFCAGWAVMQDGRLLVAGGNLGTPNGSLHTNIFDPVSKTWTRGPNMRAGRWYPSVTPLPNGELLITGGQTETGANNTLHEVWQTNGTLRQLTGATTNGRDFEHYFPWMHVAPNGLVFHAGWNNTMSYLNTAGAGSWSSQTWVRQGPGRYYGSSVMYTPGRIITIGGGGTATATTTLIELGGTGVTSVAGPSMAFARTHLNATLLANGRVFVNGGNRGPLFDDSSSVFDSEIWNPASNTWTTTARAQRPRNYHAVALLLPDATVWTAGSGGCGAECQPGSGSARAGVNQLNYEIYYPPYLFNSSGSLAARPTISSMPSSIRYGQSFSIVTPDAANIQSVTLLGLGASTHAFNYTQRFLALPIQSRDASSLTVAAPASANLAPPTYYMVFIINQSGVPSVARIVRVEP
ncbi:NPCBM/NEW2 domain-containing protein [Meiothermus sp.]|uniref:NPCBM/NEW2 domain-containing protein n=1 Tax=Meiothermus sp. TaxID=1955249 RepID=UPI00262356BD|nr:NPCBM/NEW2 domain-containing protein [Meiothermus sp.]